MNSFDAILTAQMQVAIYISAAILLALETGSERE